MGDFPWQEVSARKNSELFRYLQSREYRGTIIVIGDNVRDDVIFCARSCRFGRVVAVDGNVTNTNSPHNIRNQDKDARIEVVSTFVSIRPELFLNQTTRPAGGKWFLTEVPVGPDSTRVFARTLDEVCSNKGCINIIKIDVDAHELEILKSGAKTLRKHHPDLCVKTYRGHTGHISKLLQGCGYTQVKVLEDSTIYFVHIGWLAVTIVRILAASPLWISSRSVWRWRRITSQMAMMRQRRRW